ncbi:MAG: radical SAM protein [Candidatus Helarchaeota archaeon]|nr:radical SAM protein [Candidatus Helarchaeota archaeon]
MYENLTGVQHKSAIVDVTDRCNLRCKHCFYFREEHDSREMKAGEFLKGLRILQKRHNIISMGWSGGEPLFRTEVVQEGAKLFSINQLFTNGTLPIPKMRNLMTFISLDGTRPIHDEVRGKGTYDKIMENLKSTSAKPIFFLATFHRFNEKCLEEMVMELSEVGRPVTGMMAMLFTPLKKYKEIKGYKHSKIQKNRLDLSWEERDRIIDRLLELRSSYPKFLLNEEVNLEMMRSENAPEATSRCNMPQRTLTLDLNLNRKLPCVLGADVDCTKCGCPFPYEQEARRRGLKPKFFALNTGEKKLNEKFYQIQKKNM